MTTDILLGDDLDIDIKDGDFFHADCTRQNQALLILVEKGELREFPTRGVGIRTWVLDDTSGNLNAAVKREFEADGMTVLKVRQVGGVIQTEAVYEN